MISVDKLKCAKCGKCVMVCKHGVFFQKEKGTVPEIDGEIMLECVKCGHCIAICPSDAVSNDNINFPECRAINRDEIPDYDKTMNFIRSRRSCRNYKSDPVPGELFSKVLNAARYSPTAKNSQGVNAVIIEGEKVKKLAELTFDFYKHLVKLVSNPITRFGFTLAAGRAVVKSVEANGELFEQAIEHWMNGTDYLFYHAPAIIVTHAARHSALPKDDCDYALMNMIYAAESLGLGTCINGFLSKAAERSREIQKFLKIPKSHQVYNAMTIGYPSLTFKRAVSRDPLSVTYIK